MSSDLVQKFPSLGECNRYTDGMCSTRSCLERGGWKQGDTVDYDLATCETRDIRKTIEALEAEVAKLNAALDLTTGRANEWFAERDIARARAERLREALEKIRTWSHDPSAQRTATQALDETARKALEDDKQ